jgi:FtsZ-binding cell division protein ZapB
MTTANETEIETAPANDAEEIQRLRKTKDSLHQTAQQRKARIEELEAEVSTLKTNLDTAQKRIYDATIALPIRAMAREISTVPKLFEREFTSRFGLIDRDGVLYVTNTGESEPIKTTDGELAFTARGIASLLNSDAVNAEDKAMFRAILIGSKATGSGASGVSRGNATTAPVAPSKKPVAPSVQFGLK